MSKHATRGQLPLSERAKLLLPADPTLDDIQKLTEIQSKEVDLTAKHQEIELGALDRRHVFTRYWGPILVSFGALAITAVSLLLQTVNHSDDSKRAELDSEEKSWHDAVGTVSIRPEAASAKKDPNSGAVLLSQYLSSTRFGSDALWMDSLILKYVDDADVFDTVLGRMLPYMDQIHQPGLARLDSALSRGGTNDLLAAQAENKLEPDQLPKSRNGSAFRFDARLLSLDPDIIFIPPSMLRADPAYRAAALSVHLRASIQDALVFLWRRGDCLRQDPSSDTRNCLDRLKNETQYRIHPDDPRRSSDRSIYWNVGADLSPDKIESLRQYLHSVYLLPCEKTIDSLGLPAAGATLPDHLDITQADLTRAYLSNLTIHCVRLSQASLAYADISGSHFKGVWLNGTDLSGASALGTEFVNVDLTEANFSNARFDGTTIFQNDSNARTNFQNSVWTGANWWDANIQIPELRSYLACKFPRPGAAPVC